MFIRIGREIRCLPYAGFLYKHFPWKIGHRFPWISWILVNFYISWYLLVSPEVVYLLVSPGISWCCISPGISWYLQKLYISWYLLVFPEVVYLLVSPGVVYLIVSPGISWCLCWIIVLDSWPLHHPSLEWLRWLRQVAPTTIIVVCWSLLGWSLKFGVWSLFWSLFVGVCFINRKVP